MRIGKRTTVGVLAYFLTLLSLPGRAPAQLSVTFGVTGSNCDVACRDQKLNELKAIVMSLNLNSTDHLVNVGDIDECAYPDLNVCSERGSTCSNQFLAYECACDAGYRDADPSQPVGSTCADVDECAEGTHDCLRASGVCANTEGSHRCGCVPGYTGDGVTACQDVDECATGAHACSFRATCENTQGGYGCACRSGYRGDGMTCDDVDECAEDSSACDANAVCKNEPGYHRCMCKDGFEGSGRSCRDIDECAADEKACANHQGSRCVNAPGSFACQCPSGFAEIELGRLSWRCVDVDECSYVDCHEGASCVNTAGSYMCACASGYYSDGDACVDVNECRDKTICAGDNRMCENTNGSYDCLCGPGFEQQGANCVRKITERCNGTCHPTLGYCNEATAECQCSPGYQGNGSTCTNVNECHGDTDLCSASALCVDNEGSYSCACAAGWTLDMTTSLCVDIDECSPQSSCDSNAECVNTPGSFRCSCKSGYISDSTLGKCVDVDECAREAMCSLHAVCGNVDGSFSCTCNSGFLGNGFECGNINECLTGEAECPGDSTCHDKIGTYSCVCPVGFEFANGTCRDIDECSLRSPCELCTNTIGSFRCACAAGYSPDPASVGQCVDDNECTSGQARCPAGSTCSNTPGSYQCDCSAGHTFDYSSMMCVDVDECATAVASCPIGVCSNTDGGYRCECPIGYSKDGERCADIDECEARAGFCSAFNAHCANRAGGYWCECETGSHFRDSFCVPDDSTPGAGECDQTNPCHERAVCSQVGAGNFTCTCVGEYFGPGDVCYSLQTACAIGDVTEGCNGAAHLAPCIVTLAVALAVAAALW